jgi:hypothetical protein
LEKLCIKWGRMEEAFEEGQGRWASDDDVSMNVFLDIHYFKWFPLCIELKCLITY